MLDYMKSALDQNQTSLDKLSDRLAYIKKHLKRLSRSEINNGLTTIEKLEKEIEQKLLETNAQLKLMLPIYRESVFKKIEIMRIQSDIIQPISPETSDYLNSQIVSAESSANEFIESLSESTHKSWNFKELDLMDAKMQKDFASVYSTIKIARNCIKSTLDKFKD